MLKGIFVLSADGFSSIYGQVQDEIRQLVQIDAPPQTAEMVHENPDILHDVDVLFTGWGGPGIDAAFLQAMPNLQAVFYGAGAINPVVTHEFWARNIPITSSAAANA